MSASTVPLHAFTHIDAIFAAQHAAFARQSYPSAAERAGHLDAVHRMLSVHGDDIADAISEDFGHRARRETRIIELFPSIEAVKYARANVARWMQPQHQRTSPWFFPGRSRVLRQPVGVAGIIVPWNYPVNMTFGPLAGALAAGNRVMLKMSEFTPRTGTLLATLFRDTFAGDHVAIITGGVDAARAFSALPFGHLLFTGSTSVGREVMAAAAAHLTPVTLELGGKSPAIIAPDVDIATAARRILLGKCVNAGQTCIAPDYVMLPDANVGEFIAHARAIAAEFYPTGARSTDYASVINERHHTRLTALADDARARGAAVDPIMEGADVPARKFPLAIVRNVTDDMRIMQEEIFGPLLPVVPYASLDAALAQVNARPHPLAMYYFDHDGARTARVLRDTVAGGVTVNDTLLHFAQEALPFGGAGASGMGRYHGEHGFNTFSLHKSVYYRSRLNVTRLFEPPFGERLERVLKWIGR